MAEKKAAETEATWTAVTFRSEGGLYAFGIETITEIMTATEVTPIPGLPRHIPGVINLRGEVIPVIDFRRRLGFEDAEPTGKETFMVISHDGVTAAVKTDMVVTSVTYTAKDYMTFGGDSAAAGIIMDVGERITLIDPQKLLKDKR
ncbi:MAG: chemotaxis protein CheW [Ruminococcus sp.]|nr:chemotaxis protein CheW [Ruminococcus sp.]